MKLKTGDEVTSEVPWFVLDAKKSIEDIHQEIVKITEKILEEDKKDIKPLFSK
jgi:thymidylate kinase